MSLPSVKFVAVVALAPLLTHIAAADVFNMPAGQTSLQFVTVGNPGNAPDSTAGLGSFGYGEVDYTFEMGEFLVTAAQYAQFLNAVASTSDPYGLYNPGMASSWSVVQRATNATGFHYSVDATHQNYPITVVSWGDAARFCNWLSNGQPVGLEGNGTTESGSYSLNGAVTDSALYAVTRNANATFVIPSENEWYKAAYYNPADGSYWRYPTQSNTAPGNALPDTGNNANYQINGVLTDPISRLTPVGAFVNSPGPYGTFDMGGEVYQWNDAQVEFGTGAMFRGTRGAPYDTFMNDSSPKRFQNPPTTAGDNLGFRIALEVPEPASLWVPALSLFIWIPRSRTSRTARIYYRSVP